MKLGLISDTHDNVFLIRKAVDLFNKEHVDLVFHAGDYVSPFSVKPLFSLECGFKGVFGNNDGDRLALQHVSQGRISNSPLQETIMDKKILLGHYFETLEALISSQQYYLIIYGHTHNPEIRKVGKTLIVNPGECGGWLNGRPTIAIANFESQTAELIELQV